MHWAIGYLIKQDVANLYKEEFNITDWYKEESNIINTIYASCN
jgi:hypothetical protein